MTSLAVGQEVVVHDVNHRKGEPPKRGRIVKVGRKLVTISTGPGRWQEQQFRIDEQRANDDYGHQRFRTMAQHEEDQRRAAAWSTIREHGLEKRLGGDDWPIEKLEAVADTLRSFPSSTARSDV